MKLDLENATPGEIQKLRDDFKNYGGLVFNDNTLYNPLAELPEEFRESPHLFYTWLLSRPEYISFLCSEFLNVHLLPFQCVILQEMWKRKFPMLVATRGAGKSFLLGVYVILRQLLLPERKMVIAGASFRQSKLIYEYCSQIWNNAPLLRDCVKGCSNYAKLGPRGGVDSVHFDLGSSTATFIPVGCLHPESLVTTKNGIKQIQKLKDNFDSVYGEGKQRKIGFFYDSGISPSHNIETEFGYSYTGTPNHKMKVLRDNEIVWVRTDEIIIGDKILIDNSIRWFEETNSLNIEDAYLLGVNIKNTKEFPEIVLSSPKNSVESFILGCINSCSENNILKLPSLEIAKTIQYILLHFGVVVKLNKELSEIELYEDFDPKAVKNNTNSTYNIYSGVFFDKVVKNERSIMQKMYDINVPEGNLYCSNGFISHNTGETIRGLRANDIITDEFKCVRANTLIETESGTLEIQNYAKNGFPKLLNMNGEYESPIQWYASPPQDVYEIKTDYGYSFGCSEKHRVMTNDGWKLGKDLVPGDRIKLDQYKLYTNKYVYEDGIKLDEDLAWLFGLLISEGTVTNRNYFIFTNTDKNLIDKVKNTFDYIEWKENYRKAYEDKRGWKCKDCWNIQCNNTKLRSTFKKMGLEYSSSKEKVIPAGILKSPKDVIISFLSGLYEGDGSAFFNKNKNSKDGEEFRVVYYSSSHQMLVVLQQILLKLGVFSSINKRECGEILVTRSSNAVKLFGLLNVLKWKHINLDENIKDVRKSYIRKNTLKNGKVKYYCSTSVDNKNIHIGTFNSEEEANEAFELYNNSLISCLKVTSVEKLPEKEVLYDFSMPETQSFIGNGFVQHNSHNKEIFENVIAGFAAVESSPQEKVASRLELEFNRIAGIEHIIPEHFQENVSNQIVISGTAYYYFNHFAEYWERWKKIVMSKGQESKLQEIFPDGVPTAFNWKDYSVIRLPWDLLPSGYMDEGNLARSKATLHSGLYRIEFGAVFSKDSDGFFKASLIESCVCNPSNEIEKASGPVVFQPKLSGDADKIYYMGVDTASQVDNFAIVIQEMHEDHRRIVYCWTTNTKAFKEARKSGDIEETDFFRYCSRKIRDLMSRFNIKTISIDSQGGGRTIYESLHDKESLKPGEQMLWEITEPGVIKDTDIEEGLHIIEMVNFRKQDYTVGANHGLKKDFEEKLCLFPEYNPAILAIYANLKGKFAQEMEDCVEDIEELKRELTQIVVTSTATGSERFDTPEVKLSGSTKTRARKDRYSALIMSNMRARTDYDFNTNYSRRSIQQISESSQQKEEVSFIGQPWLVRQLDNLYE
jgi:intein/homing endonuclease